MEIRRYFVLLKDDKNTSNENLCDAGKVMLRNFLIEQIYTLRGRKAEKIY